MIYEAQIEFWRAMKEEMLQDQRSIKFRNDRDIRRQLAHSEILQLWNDFRTNQIGLEDFRSIFDRKSRTSWDTFGLGGMSGAMFLNMLVKHIPNQLELADILRDTLTCPEQVDDGWRKIQGFQSYLQDLINGGTVAKREIQPARLSFLISAFWHMQDTETWPIYYASGRRAFLAEGLYQEVGSVTEDYFSFREIFLSLSHALQLQTWDMEYLSIWHQERNTEIAPPVELIPTSEVLYIADDIPEKLSVDKESKHSHMQWLLAKIGQKFGYKVWIASNDRKRAWNGETLGKYSITEMPYFNGVGPKSQRMIELIDVLWIKGSNKIVAAFEVESTTSIFSGLLRMSDLLLALENLTFSTYIVVPQERIDEVKEQLSRLTFQQLGLHEVCRFFSFEELIENADSIMKWASEATAIDKIAQRVGDVGDEGYY